MPDPYPLPDGSTVSVIRYAEWRETPDQHAPDLYDGSPGHFAVVHHSAGGYADTPAEELAMVRQLDRQAKAKGWARVGYSFLVGGTGTLYEGRGWDFEPAATGSGNPGELDDDSFAVCMMGYHDSNIYSQGKVVGSRVPDPVTDAEATAIGRLFAAGVTVGRLTTDVKIIGHSQNPEKPNATVCPGDAGLAALPAVVRAFFAALTPPPPPPPPTSRIGCPVIVQPGDFAAWIGGRAAGMDRTWRDRRAIGVSILDANGLTEAALGTVIGQALYVPGYHVH